MKADMTHLAVIAGFFFHYLINTVANCLEKQSNYVEIDNISEILRKLNKKSGENKIVLVRFGKSEYK